MTAAKQEQIKPSEFELCILHRAAQRPTGSISPLERVFAARAYVLAAERANDELHQCWASDIFKRALEGLDESIKASWEGDQDHDRPGCPVVEYLA